MHVHSHLEIDMQSCAIEVGSKTKLINRVGFSFKQAMAASRVLQAKRALVAFLSVLVKMN